MGARSTETMTARHGELARPLPLLAVAVLLLNDHVLKGAGVLPGWLTGKLSDVAGLFFFPILVASLASRVVGPRRVLPIAAALATGVVFSVLKLCPAACDWVRFWGVVVCDPTDLLALPSLAFAYAYMKRESPVVPRLLRWGGVLVAAFASMATSQAPVRGYPSWQLTGGTAPRDVGCATIEAYVVKSGKEGIGVAVAVRAPRETCAVRITKATLFVEQREVAAAGPATLTADGHAYVPLAFDNEALWNAGQRNGTLGLDVVVNEQETHVSLPMFHKWDGPYAPPNRRPPPPPPPPPSAPVATDDAGASLPLATDPQQ